MNGRLSARMVRLEAAAGLPVPVHVLVGPDGLDNPGFNTWAVAAKAGLPPEARVVLIHIRDAEVNHGIAA